MSMKPNNEKALILAFPELENTFIKKNVDILDKRITSIESKIEEVKKQPGPKGDTPIKGRDYFTAEEVKSMIEFILKNATPQKGIHYNDGRSPIIISETEPQNAQAGDLWFKP